MQRPFVHLNCAVDSVGHVAGPGGAKADLSSAEDWRRVHQLRADYDAIVVGVETVLADDPSLRVKPEYAEGTDPIAVILDSQLRTPPTARCLRPETRIYHIGGQALPDTQCIRIGRGAGGVDVPAVLADLKEAGVGSVLVEGGPRVLSSFVSTEWDKFTIFQSNQTLSGGPRLWDGLPRVGVRGVSLVGKAAFGGGTLWTFAPNP